MTKISIITLCRDTPVHMKNCFDSVLTYTDGIGFDVEWIIVDNASMNPAMIEYFNYIKKYPGVHVIHNAHNDTFSVANNMAVEKAIGDYLVFMNSDVFVTKGWMNEMIKCIQKDKVAAVGARLYFPHSETIQHAGIIQRDDGIFTHRYYRQEASNHPEIMEESEMPVTAALMMIKKTVFEEVGGFDEGFKWGYEDVDLNMKLISADYKIMYCPTCFAYHHEHGTDANINDKLGDNIQYLFKKWGINKDKI